MMASTGGVPEATHERDKADMAEASPLCAAHREWDRARDVLANRARRCSPTAKPRLWTPRMPSVSPFLSPSSVVPSADNPRGMGRAEGFV